MRARPRNVAFDSLSVLSRQDSHLRIGRQGARVSEPKCDAGSRCEIESCVRSGFSVLVLLRRETLTAPPRKNSGRFFHGFQFFARFFRLRKWEGKNKPKG